MDNHHRTGNSLLGVGSPAGSLGEGSLVVGNLAVDSLVVGILGVEGIAEDIDFHRIHPVAVDC